MGEFPVVRFPCPARDARLPNSLWKAASHDLRGMGDSESSAQNVLDNDCDLHSRSAGWLLLWLAHILNLPATDR